MEYANRVACMRCHALGILKLYLPALLSYNDQGRILAGIFYRTLKMKMAAGLLQPFIHHPVHQNSPGDDCSLLRRGLILVQRFLGFTPPRSPSCLTRNQVFEMLPVDMSERDVIA